MPPLALPHTDWLRHDLTVSGPPADVAAFGEAAAGAGLIPWTNLDLELEEEDRVHALVSPPDGSPGLSAAAARILARQLRDAAQVRQLRALDAAGASRVCPLDLHALLPVPAALLQAGPADAAVQAWLWQHWGTTRALRHVRLRPAQVDGRRRRTARRDYEFWSADWTPWAALCALRRAWPALAIAACPDYRDG